jgi:quinol monooxygenase YgiN
MQLFIFARFHARDGEEDTVGAAMRDMLGPSREEPGCLAIEVFRGTRDPRLFYVHSRWIDEAAFDVHAELPHTLRFIERVQRLIDHQLEVTRTRPLA